MKKLTFLIYLLLTAFEITADEIPGFFTGNLQSLFETAKSKKQIVMIDFYTIWCTPCKQMEANIYRQESFLPYTKKMVSYKIDAEKGEGRDLAAQYKVVSFPTVIFMDSDGKEIERIIGYEENLKKYYDNLDRIIDGVDVFSNWEKKYKTKKTLELSNKLAKHYMSFDFKKAEEYYQNSLKLDSMGTQPETIELMAKHAIKQLSEDPINGEIECKSFIAKFPDSRFTFPVIMNFVQYLSNSDPEKALVMFRPIYEKSDSATRQNYIGLYSILQDLAKKPIDNDKKKKQEIKKELSLIPKMLQTCLKLNEKNEKNKIRELLLTWLKKNKDTSMEELQFVGMFSNKVKVAELEFAKALKRKWKLEPESEHKSNIADTIADLFFQGKDKTNAIKFAELACNLESDGTEYKKTLENKLKRFKSEN